MKSLTKEEQARRLDEAVALIVDLAIKYADKIIEDIEQIKSA